jgi:hypothetical protein
MKRNEPFVLTDSEGDYVNPHYIELKPGMVVPRIPAYRHGEAHTINSFNPQMREETPAAIAGVTRSDE